LAAAPGVHHIRRIFRALGRCVVAHVAIGPAFFTGVGVGCGMANAIALTSEFFLQRKRASMTVITARACAFVVRTRLQYGDASHPKYFIKNISPNSGWFHW
jgi:hypothetical protein